MALTYDAFLSEAEYLRVEEAAKERSEYVAGGMFAMSGATKNHNRIVKNLILDLDAAVGSFGCDVFAIDMRLKLQPLRTYYYPDLMVTCEPDRGSDIFAAAPCLVVEVLSPSTESIDRREKLLAYGCIDSIREYLIISQDKRLVTLFRKDEHDSWQSTNFQDSEIVILKSLPCGDFSLGLDKIYNRVLI